MNRPTGKATERQQAFGHPDRVNRAFGKIGLPYRNRVERKETRLDLIKRLWKRRKAQDRHTLWIADFDHDSVITHTVPDELMPRTEDEL